MLTRGLQWGGGFQPAGGDGGGGGAPQLTVQGGTCIAIAHPAANTVMINAQVACIQSPWVTNIDAAGHTLNNSGHIGIGMASNPAYAITAAGDINLSSGHHFLINGAPLALGQMQTPWLSDIDGADYTLRHVRRIGIGMAAAPAYPLDVVGQMHIQNAPFASETSFIFSSDVGNYTLVTYGLASGVRQGQFALRDHAGIDQFVISQTGSVGIGVSPGPGIKLEVNGDLMIRGNTQVVAPGNAIVMPAGWASISSTNQCYIHFRGALGGAWMEIQSQTGLTIHGPTTIVHGLTVSGGNLVVQTGGLRIGASVLAHGSRLVLTDLPTSAAGLQAGDVWRDGNDLKIV